MSHYPHKESATTNLCEDYKADLEKAALREAQANSEYQAQAIKFLLDTGTRLEIFKTGSHESDIGLQDVYTIRIGNAYKKESFELTDCFKNSVNATSKGNKLTPYDVLAYFSIYAHGDNFYSPDDVYESYGEMKPSQAKAIFEEQQNTRKILNMLYTEKQLEALSEIQ